jgi:hypothetical protein
MIIGLGMQGRVRFRKDKNVVVEEADEVKPGTLAKIEVLE